jgi:hypothetical protein
MLKVIIHGTGDESGLAFADSTPGLEDDGKTKVNRQHNHG